MVILNRWEELQNFARNQGGVRVEQLVNMKRVFPYNVSFDDADLVRQVEDWPKREMRIDEIRPRVEISFDFRVNSLSFPILSVLEEAELAVFIDTDIPFMKMLFGPTYELQQRMLDGPLWQLTWKSSPIARRFAVLNGLFSNKELIRQKGSPVEQYLWFFGSIELCNKIDLVNFYKSNLDRMSLIFSRDIRHDQFGQVILPDLKVRLKPIFRQHGVEMTDEAVVDLLLIHRVSEGEASQIDPKRNDGIAYEEECATRLMALGFRVKATPRTGDFGADLVAEKDSLTMVVQCKSGSRPVGISAVQEAIGARSHYQADACVVLAEHGFTNSAQQLAQSGHVLLTSLARFDERNLPLTW